MAALLGGFQTPRAPGAPTPKRALTQPPAIPGGYETPRPLIPPPYASGLPVTNPVNTPQSPQKPAQGATAAAKPMAPAPVTADPRDSQYFAEYAKLNQQYQDQTARSSFLAAADTANAGYAQNALDQQLPRNVYNARVRANQQGVLGSGMENVAVSDVAQRYAQQRYQLTSGLASKLAQLGQANQSAAGNFQTGGDAAYQAAVARATQQMLANPAAFTPPPGGFTAPPTRMQVVQQAGFQTPYTTAAQRRQTVQRARKGRK